MRLGTHLWSKTRGRVAVQGLLFVLALGGSYLLYVTGDHGAEMVYRYGVGVQGASPNGQLSSRASPLARADGNGSRSPPGPGRNECGGW